MNMELHRLVLQRLTELGQDAFSAHEELEKWHPEPLSPGRRTALSVALKQALEEQAKWLRALEEELEEELAA